MAATRPRERGTREAGHRNGRPRGEHFGGRHPGGGRSRNDIGGTRRGRARRRHLREFRQGRLCGRRRHQQGDQAGRDRPGARDLPQYEGAPKMGGDLPDRRDLQARMLCHQFRSQARHARRSAGRSGPPRQPPRNARSPPARRPRARRAANSASSSSPFATPMIDRSGEGDAMLVRLRGWWACGVAAAAICACAWLGRSIGQLAGGWPRARSRSARPAMWRRTASRSAAPSTRPTKAGRDRPGARDLPQIRGRPQDGGAVAGSWRPSRANASRPPLIPRPARPASAGRSAPTNPPPRNARSPPARRPRARAGANSARAASPTAIRTTDTGTLTSSCPRLSRASTS